METVEAEVAVVVVDSVEEVAEEASVAVEEVSEAIVVVAVAVDVDSVVAEVTLELQDSVKELDSSQVAVQLVNCSELFELRNHTASNYWVYFLSHLIKHYILFSNHRTIGIIQSIYYLFYFIF